jgi:hypothetical protein
MAARLAPAAPAVFTTNQKLTAAQQSNFEATCAFLANPPRCSLYLAGAGTATSSAWHLLSFDTDPVDTDGFWAVGNPSRLVIPVAGTYALTFSTGAEGVQIRKNAAGSATGGTQILLDPGTAQSWPYTSSSYQGTTGQLDVAALSIGDYLELFYFYGTPQSGQALTYFTATMEATS